MAESKIARTGAFITGITLGVLGYLAVPVAEADQVIASTVIYWDEVTEDINGGPEICNGQPGVCFYESVILGEEETPADFLEASLPKKQVGGPGIARESGLAGRFVGKAPGNYSYWVRAVDQAGNVSAWAGPLILTWDNAAPRPPVNLRFTITVEVSP